MVSTPAIAAVTTPLLLTLAVVLLALHAPPLAELESVIGAPTHTLEGPVITPVTGTMPTATVWLTVATPQTLLRVYMIVSIPVDTAVTTPPLTVAVALLALQVPPGSDAVNVMVAPLHTALAPVMVPASAPAVTVIVNNAVAVPQLLVTV